MNTPYVYLHCKPDGTPFYVGKGTGGRHLLSRVRNAYHKRTVDKYGRKNILVGKVLCSTHAVALELEIGVIKCLKRMGHTLTNLTAGGEGTLGTKKSVATKEKMSLAAKGRVFSDEHRARISEARKGTTASEEAKANISAASRGHIVSDSTRAAISKANTGRPCPDNTRKKVGAANALRVWDAEARARHAVAMTGIKKPAQSATMRARGQWVGENNPFYGMGEQQRGAKNHMACRVRGVHKYGILQEWETMQAAADYLGVTVQAVAQSIRKGFASKGWRFEKVVT